MYRLHFIETVEANASTKDFFMKIN